MHLCGEHVTLAAFRCFLTPNVLKCVCVFWILLGSRLSLLPLPFPPSLCLLLLEPQAPSFLTQHLTQDSSSVHLGHVCSSQHASLFSWVCCSSASPLELISTMKFFTTTCALLGLLHAQTALVTPFLLGVNSSLRGCGLLLHFLLCNPHHPRPVQLLLPCRLPLLFEPG